MNKTNVTIIKNADQKKKQSQINDASLQKEQHNKLFYDSASSNHMTGIGFIGNILKSLMIALHLR